jgi:hypothetical protein
MLRALFSTFSGKAVSRSAGPSVGLRSLETRSFAENEARRKWCCRNALFH